MGCRWSEVQILSPRPEIEGSPASAGEPFFFGPSRVIDRIPDDASPAFLQGRAQLDYHLADAMLKVGADEEALTKTAATMGMTV